MSLAYYNGSQPASSAAGRHSENSKHRRRYSAEACHSLRGQIDREHRALAASNPRSPRVKPLLRDSQGCPNTPIACALLANAESVR